MSGYKGKSCSWCGELIKPNAARMRLHQSESIAVVGIWLAHYHPKCGDDLLDYCEERLALKQAQSLETAMETTKP